MSGTIGARAQGLHRRIQPLLVFFIDACNFLEDAVTGAVDSRWEMYLAVRRQGERHIVVRQLRLALATLSHDFSTYHRDMQANCLTARLAARRLVPSIAQPPLWAHIRVAYQRPPADRRRLP